MIPEDLLLNYGAVLEEVPASEFLFMEKTPARSFYQIKTGEIKMFNMNENGKEFIQGFFYDGESFGEPPLLTDRKYPASASAVKSSQVYKLSKAKFLKLLTANPGIHLKLTKELANRLFYKATILNEISGHPPEHRILTLIDYLKREEQIEKDFKVNLTRQQIADLTGLRVETVIRAIKKLEQYGEIRIFKRKVYR